MTREIFALVLAAGSGRRMGAGQNKMALTLFGRTLLEHALVPFSACDEVSGLVAVVPAAEQADWQRRLREPKLRLVVAGGATRQASVCRGLRAIATELARPDRRTQVLIHDGARAFTPQAVVRRVIDRLAGDPCGVAPYLPLSDTVHFWSDERFCQGPPRCDLAAVQTPQGADLALLTAAFEWAEQAGAEVTDDLSLLARLGCPVRLVEGDVRGLKLTTPFDLAIARALFDPDRADE